MFIKDIDKKIGQSYQCLRQGQENGDESLGLNQSKTINDSTQLQDPSSMFSQLSVSVNRSFETPAKHERAPLHEKGGFMKLEDSEIMEYIRMVYDMYDIPDPMAGVHPQDQPTSRAGSTNKRVRIFKNSIQ